MMSTHNYIISVSYTLRNELLWQKEESECYMHCIYIRILHDNHFLNIFLIKSLYILDVCGVCCFYSNYIGYMKIARLL